MLKLVPPEQKLNYCESSAAYQRDTGQAGASADFSWRRAGFTGLW